MERLDYDTGDTIAYLTFSGHERVVVVAEREDDVKNGRPGFVGTVTLPDGDSYSVWGYDDQITRVVALALG